VGTYATPPTEEAVLKEFYRRVRPWGFWGPIRELVVAEDPGFRPNDRFGADMTNVVVGIVWQTCLTLLPIYLVLRDGVPLVTTVLILGVTVMLLKRRWYDRLEAE
jgi:solute:Na+ symporter, SSS family